MPEAKKAPKEVKETKKTKVKSTPSKPRGLGTPRTDGIYEATGSYNPKAKKNVSTYEEICAVLPATLADITKAIPQHEDFVGYLIRRSGIAPK